MPGVFIISLDFELIWGVRDKKTKDKYGDNIIGARAAIPMILELFQKYKIHCTWATVGLLFCRDKNEMMSALPDRKPRYENPALSSYSYLDEVLDNEETDPYHFAHRIIDLIRKYDGQEIGSHSFSHYYCHEPGQTISDFEADINSAVHIAAKHGISLRSFVFPRNQVIPEYLPVLKKLGFICYRGNPESKIYRMKNLEKFDIIRNGLRFIDNYINLLGHKTYTLGEKEPGSEEIMNIPASAFLRPYNEKLKIFEKMKIRRIFKSMHYAARKNKVFHLWVASSQFRQEYRTKS